MNAGAEIFAGLAIMLASPVAWAAPVSASSAVPGPAFDGGRYANLWTKSPFAVATPDASSATSADYQLVGLAQFDGISYASLIEKQSQEHFILASNKPVKDLKLVSVSRGPNGGSAVVMHNGESLILREEAAPLDAGSTAALRTIIPPPGMMPSPNPAVGGLVPANRLPPRARLHHLIRVPPPPPSQ